MARGPQSGPPGVSIRPARSPRNIENDRFVSVRCVFSSSKIRQNSFFAGALPRTPDPLVGWGGGHPFPFPSSLAFGISIWPPTRLKFVHLALQSKRLDSPGLDILFPVLLVSLRFGLAVVCWSWNEVTQRQARPVDTWMCDCLRAGTPSCYVTRVAR